MILEPGQTKTVKVKYNLPPGADSIYIQKQSGLKSDFKLSVDGKIFLDGNLDSDENLDFE